MLPGTGNGPVAAEVRAAEMSESDLIRGARSAISQCNWEVGRFASIWTERYSAGRGDADFGALVGYSADQIKHRRWVWNKFRDSRHTFPNLSWSHFRAAITWEDAGEFLEWAHRNGATRDEMVNFRAATGKRDGGDPEDETSDGEPIPTERPERQSAANNGEAAASAPDRVQDEPEASRETEEPSRTDERAAGQSGAPGAAGSPPPRTVTIGEVVSGLKQWAKIADPGQRAKACPDLIWTALQSIPPESLPPLVERFLAELVRRVPESRFQEIGQTLARWAPQFAPDATEDGVVPEGGSSGSVVLHVAVQQAWNLLGRPFPQCAQLTAKRRKALKSRLSDPYWEQHWQTALEVVKRTGWLRGDNDRGWVANFDWFIRPDTVVKLIESGVDVGEKLKPEADRSDAFARVFGEFAAKAEKAAEAANR